MGEAFVGMDIAVIVVSASIVLAGILIGVGRAAGYKRIEQFGIEELIQSVVNAAIIGSFAAVIELVGTISSSLVVQSCSVGSIVSQLSCSLGNLNTSLFSFIQSLIKLLTLLGYYQSLSLDFGGFSISPFANLSSVSSLLSIQLLTSNLVMILVGLNHQVSMFIADNALSLLLPVGLVLRTFFATRRVGGFLIALSIGLFVFYPAFVLIFPASTNEISNSTIKMSNFTNNSYYAAIPIVDLNNNYAIAGKIDVLSGRCVPPSTTTNSTNTTPTSCTTFITQQQNITQNQSVDFSGDITVIAQANSNALAKSLLYSAIAPLFSLIVTVVFVRELANLLGSEIGINTVLSV